MPKKVFASYKEELDYQKSIWNKKSSLRILYRIWYQNIKARLAKLSPTVELGSGCGNFKEFHPDIIATDVIKCGDHIDEIVDAMNMPYQQNSVGNFVMIDCLHHLPRPLKFIKDAGNALKPGGRIIIFEPACSQWSRFIFNNFHHETLDLTQDIFAENSTPPPTDSNFLFNNMAIATIIFINNKQRFETDFPDLTIKEISYSDFLVYPATGGFGYFSLVPPFMLKFLHSIESVICSIASKLISMRICIVIEKKI